MSPLVSAPARGYADWQRVENWDSDTLYTAPNAPTTGVTQSGVLDVSRYGYLGGFAYNAQNSTCILFITWFADQAGTITIAQRKILLTAVVTNPAHLRVPNLGPFCTLVFNPIGGASYTPRAVIFGTNRFHPLELIPISGVLMHVATNIPANGSSNFFPTDYYSGPARASIVGLGGAISVQYLYTADDGSSVQFDQFSVPSGQLQFSSNTIIVPGAWFVTVNNTNAAVQGINLSVIPSATGST